MKRYPDDIVDVDKSEKKLVKFRSDSENNFGVLESIEKREEGDEVTATILK